MAQSEEPGERAIRGPARIIETVNKVVRTTRQMLPEIGREPTPEELAEKLAMPLDKVHRVLAIANRPIRLETPIGVGVRWGRRNPTSPIPPLPVPSPAAEVRRVGVGASLNL